MMSAPPPVSPRPRAKTEKKAPPPTAAKPSKAKPAPPTTQTKPAKVAPPTAARRRAQTSSATTTRPNASSEDTAPVGMDAARRRATAYEYLCHLEEARQWMQACLQIANKLEEEKLAEGKKGLTPEQKAMLAKIPGSTEALFKEEDKPPPPPAEAEAAPPEDGSDSPPPPPPPEDPSEEEVTTAAADQVKEGDIEEEPSEEELPPASELEEALRNGVLLARIALWFAPENVSKRHTYDLDEKVFKERGLVFRHTENVNQWLKAMKKKNFPDIFYPEVTDVYDKKNMPKVVYCIHALSRYLHHLGIGPSIKDLKGVAQFTEEEISAMDSALTAAGVQMPHFGKIGGVLAAEIGEDAAAVHAAVLALNQAIEREVDADELLGLLNGITIGLEHVSSESKDEYRTDLIESRKAKVEGTGGERPSSPEIQERDIYDFNLTREEIQKSINTSNTKVAAAMKAAATAAAIDSVKAATMASDAAALAEALNDHYLEVAGVRAGIEQDYLKVFSAMLKENEELTVANIQSAIDEGNVVADKRMALSAINTAVEHKDSSELEAALNDSNSGIEGVRQGLYVDYLNKLVTAREVSGQEEPLSREAVQDCVNSVHSFLAAIVAINDAVEGEDLEELEGALTNANAGLEGVMEADKEVMQEYLEALMEASGGSQLDQAEIQTCVNEVNEKVQERRIAAEKEAKHQAAIKGINDAIGSGDPDALLQALQVEDSEIQSVNHECSLEYLAVLMDKQMSAEESFLSKDGIQAGVLEANQIIEEQKRADQAVQAINQALFDEDSTVTIGLLVEHEALLELPALEKEAAQRYHDNLVSNSKLSGHLSQKNIRKTLEKVNSEMEAERIFAAAVKSLNTAVRGEDALVTLACLQDKALNLMEIRPEVKSILCDFNVVCADRYHAALKAKIGDSEDDMTVEDAQEVVNAQNHEIDNERAVAEAVHAVNRALEEPEPAATLVTLQHVRLELTGVDDAGADQYHEDLCALKTEQARDLTREEIQKTIDTTNAVAEDNANHMRARYGLYESLSQDSTKCLACLNDPFMRVTDDVLDKCEKRYHPALQEAQSEKEQRLGVSLDHWKKFTTDDGRPYYYNKETKETSWVPPMEADEAILDAEEITAVVSACNDDQARQEHFEANQDSIVTVQSYIRGFLMRKAFLERKDYIESQTPSVIKIQAVVRMLIQRNRYRARLNFLNSQEKAAVTIQAYYKGMVARRNYKGLTKVDDPPVNTVRRFLHLLDQSEIDFSEEIKVNTLKEKAVSYIKRNAELESSITDMDIKIGLLVKNRIELQDVVEKNKALKRQQNRRGGSKVDLVAQNHGLKSLDAKTRHKLQSYEHLFYLLQTEPQYLAALAFIEYPLEGWSAQKAQRFLERIIQTTYNYASAAREQYLLLKLYRTALRNEVFLKTETAKQFQTGNRTVVGLIVNHYRGEGSDSYLANTLAPLIGPLLRQNDLDLNIDPIEVYRRWINKTESVTGTRSTLPYEVERSDALKHPEVAAQIETSYQNLLRLVSQFQDAIIDSIKRIPFGLRYCCMKLKEDLMEKFPDTTEDELLKLVGNLLYYRFFNPAIIAPEGFSVISSRDGEAVTMVQRRNLANVARMLQTAASGGSTEEGDVHADFFKSAWRKFRAFFEEVCQVPSAEEFFSIDEYSDVTMLSKPTIFISPTEIYHTHKMLATNVDDVAPNATDPLRSILQDLGEIESEDEFLGEEGSEKRVHSTGEMSLTLANKFEVSVGDDPSVRALFLRTKRNVVDIIRFQQGKTLMEILNTRATQEQEDMHRARMLDEMAKTAEAEKAKAAAKTESERKKGEFKRKASMRRLSAARDADGVVTLEALKAKVVEGALELEKHGLCSSANNYQELLNSVAQDIRNQRIYRRQRRQELHKLETTLSELDKKKEHMDEQIEQFNLYIESCMAQITKKKNVKKRGFFGKSKAKEEKEFYAGTYKYSAQRLMDKGVLLSMDNLEDSKLKHVMIEISCDEPGVFGFQAKFMHQKVGEKEELNFQDLLQLQYNNVTTTRMFENCTINVNLLIFLLNKKFYNK